MPLTELIRYFNGSELAGDSTLYGEGGRAAAWHDGLHLRSLFQPIVDLQDNCIVGHQAFLAATLDDGAALPTEAAYARCPDAESVVHFDRLCRTLHALNFLAQRQNTGGYLQLSVHPRHLLAVPNQHGLIFEAVLKRCGLAPEDIVLELAAGQHLAEPRLATAVGNYQARGYRIALLGADQLPETFSVDLLKGGLDTLPTNAAIPLHVDQINRREELAEACQQGARLAQGLLFGEKRRDCLSTHSKGRVAYNPANLAQEST